MTRYLTYFDSKRYLSFKRFQAYYAIRKKHLPTLEAQEEQFTKMFTSQSIRYTFCIKEDWIEETFESMDGNYLMYYHDLMENETLHTFFNETLAFYEYGFGGVSEIKDLEKALVAALTKSPQFTYELDSLLYQQGTIEYYLTLTFFPHGNFAIKLFEKEEYGEAVKGELIEQIHELLSPLLM